ncbi:hypothetical protein Tco_0996589, partial [Tanacetum coccineum]
MLLYSWDGGDVCVDLTWSSPLTQTGLADFVPGHAVSDAAHQLEKDVVAFLKRIQKLFVAQYIEARAPIHIFNRISFAIAKGVEAQIVSLYFLFQSLVRLAQGFFLGYLWRTMLYRSLNLCWMGGVTKPLGSNNMFTFTRGIEELTCSLGEFEEDAVTLLKQIRKFSMVQDIGARAAVYILIRISFTISKGLRDIEAHAVVHIFNRISFAIAKGVKAQILLDMCFSLFFLFFERIRGGRGYLAETDTLLKRIRKFSMAQDIGARAAIHIFNRISFAVAKVDLPQAVTKQDLGVNIISAKENAAAEATRILELSDQHLILQHLGW